MTGKRVCDGTERHDSAFRLIARARCVWTIVHTQRERESVPSCAIYSMMTVNANADNRRRRARRRQVWEPIVVVFSCGFSVLGSRADVRASRA
jgi:hypothetical protein